MTARRKVNDEQFVEIWNTSLSLRQVRERTGITTSNANVKACRLRKLGYKLKFFETFSDLPATSYPDYEPKRKPKNPTIFRPGSYEKVLILRQRAEDEEELYHPDDAKIPVVR